MMLLSDIQGQSNAVRFLERSLLSKRIADGFLFLGPKGVGRALAAKAFIMALVCRHGVNENTACGECPACRKVDALSHPDLTWIHNGKDKRIKIEEIRNVKKILSLKPYEAPVSVCVIEDAHMMTIEASNALLKILEEAPGKAMLLLISDKKELLLPTVVSRCMVVRFSPLSPREAKDIIMRNADVSEEEADFLARFSQGSPGRALEMVEEGISERKEDIISMLRGILEEENPYCMNWDKDNKGQILEDLEIMIMFFRDMAMFSEGLEEIVMDKNFASLAADLSVKYKTDKIADIVECLAKFKQALTGNVNPKLIAQALPGIISVQRRADSV